MMKWNEETKQFEANKDRKLFDFPNPHIAKLFLDEVNDLKKNHRVPEAGVADRFETTIVGLRQLMSSAHWCVRNHQRMKALEWSKEGVSYGMIAYRLGISESSVRMLLDDKVNAKMNQEEA